MRYFDHNATHPISAAARSAWLDATEKFVANPSSPHRLGSRAELALNSAREALSRILGCSPFDLVWTSGSTESNNAILHHLAKATQGEVWTSAIEHPGVLAGLNCWLPSRHRLIPVTHSGVVDLEWLKRQLTKTKPSAIAVMAANNETGVLQPWEEVRELCHSQGVLFFCDAAQWLGKLPGAGLGACDFLTACAHKFGGPTGVGFLKCPHEFHPLILGGPQEGGRRAGTENLAGVLSMVAALVENEAQIGRGELASRTAMRDNFTATLKGQLAQIEIVGESSPRLWNTVSALLPVAADCRRRWVVKLDKLGFAVSTGSACSSGKEKASHVITAMDYSPEAGDRMLRFSSGWATTKEDWDALAKAIVEAAAELQAS